MAKIQDLNVKTLNIAPNSLTEFFYPYDGTLGTARYIDIDFDAYSTPVLIWIAATSGAPSLYYDYLGPNQELITTVSGVPYVAVGDLRPAGTATYTLVGGTATITAALMRYR